MMVVGVLDACWCYKNICELFIGYVMLPGLISAYKSRDLHSLFLLEAIGVTAMVKG